MEKPLPPHYQKRETTHFIAIIFICAPPLQLDNFSIYSVVQQKYFNVLEAAQVQDFLVDGMPLEADVLLKEDHVPRCACCMHMRGKEKRSRCSSTKF